MSLLYLISFKEMRLPFLTEMEKWRLDLSSHIKWLKMIKNIWNNGFHIRHQAMKESDSWGTGKNVKPYGCPQLAPWIKFPGHGLVTRKQNVWWSCWVKETVLGLQEAKNTRVQGRVLKKRKVHRERASDICRGSSLSFELRATQYIPMRKLTEARGKMIRENNSSKGTQDWG